MSSNDKLPADIAIAGRGLHLREWTDTDLAVMVELFDEQQIARWTPLVSPFDLAAAEAYLAKARRARAAGAGIQLAITSDGLQALGEVLLYRTGKDRSDGEIAYAVGARYRRQRLAVRAVQLMTAYAYDQLGMGRAILRVAADNEGSVGVALAAGFQLSDEPPVVRERKGGKISLLTWCHQRIR
jgi:RimJ/RimL family protein N-acetyltransferase